MGYSTSKIPNIRTIKAIRGESLTIDLGKTFEGNLSSWMKKDPNAATYRSFQIIDNRYLFLTKEKASDYYDGEDNLIESIKGKWYFDVERIPEGGDPEDSETIYRGTISFQNDITGSNGVEILDPIIGSTFLGLEDTPENYSTPGQFVVINDSGDGLDFSPLSVDNFVTTNTEQTIQAKKTFLKVTPDIEFYNEDFESGFPPEFTTSGDEDWFIAIGEGNGGGNAARSGDISDNELSSLLFTFMPSSEITLLEFDLKIDNEQDFDPLVLRINGVEVARYLTNTDWVKKGFYITGINQHTVEWSYEKDGAISSGEDACWVDNVILKEVSYDLILDTPTQISQPFTAEVGNIKRLVVRENLVVESESFFNDISYGTSMRNYGNKRPVTSTKDAYEFFVVGRDTSQSYILSKIEEDDLRYLSGTVNIEIEEDNLTHQFNNTIKISNEDVFRNVADNTPFALWESVRAISGDAIKTMFRFVGETKDRAASFLSSRLHVGFPTFDKDNMNVLDVNGNIVSRRTILEVEGDIPQAVPTKEWVEGEVADNTFVEYNSDKDTYDLEVGTDGYRQPLGENIFVNIVNDNGIGSTKLNPEVFVTFGINPTYSEFQNATKAKASDISTKAIYGLNATEALVGEKAKMLVYGHLHDIDTSQWSVNTLLYIDPVIDGALTDIKPEINAYYIGKVEISDPINGLIFVNTIDSNSLDQDISIYSRDIFNFTAEEIITSEGTFFRVLPDDKGSVASDTITASVNDNQILPGSQDLLYDIITVESTIGAGTYESTMEISVDSGGAGEQIFVELYEADPDGVAIDSGIASEPIGSLGVKPVFVYKSSILNLDANDTFFIPLLANLTEDYIVDSGNRFRFRLLFSKIGTAGGAKDFTLYVGNEHTSFTTGLSKVTSDDVDNTSGVSGSTVTDALNTLNTEVKTKTQWLYPYTGTVENPTIDIQKNTETTIANWNVISNKITSDYPIPYLLGNPNWNVPDQLLWSTDDLLGDVICVYDFTAQTAVEASAFRIWSTGVVGNVYTTFIYDYNNPLNPILLNGREIINQSTVGWIEVFDDVEFTFLQGSRYRIGYITSTATGDTSYFAPYTNLDNNLPSSNGDFNYKLSNEEIYIHVNDNDGLSREVDLLLLKENDTIQVQEVDDTARVVKFIVTGTPTSDGTYITIPISDIENNGNIRNNRVINLDWFVAAAPVNTDYVYEAGTIDNYFNGVRTFVTNNFNDVLDSNIVLGEDTFGIDLFTEAYVQSPDWDIKSAPLVTNSSSVDKNNSDGIRGELEGTEIDWGSKITDFTKTLIQNEVFTDINLPSGVDTKVLTLNIIGDFAITLPAYWKLMGSGSYDGNVDNTIVIFCLNGDTQDIRYWFHKEA